MIKVFTSTPKDAEKILTLKNAEKNTPEHQPHDLKPEI
jgi:hypothetical protein